jgi:hypothetical protein
MSCREGTNDDPLWKMMLTGELFVERLGQMSARLQVAVYAYVLMGNHYHLLLRTWQAHLSRSLQWLGAVYSGRYNIRHQRSGHLTLSCYVHSNPLRAKLGKRLADYRWSSHAAYAYGRNQPDWLEEEVILAPMPGPNKRQAYRQKVQGVCPGTTKSLGRPKTWAVPWEPAFYRSYLARVRSRASPSGKTSAQSRGQGTAARRGAAKSSGGLAM